MFAPKIRRTPLPALVLAVPLVLAAAACGNGDDGVLDTGGRIDAGFLRRDLGPIEERDAEPSPPDAQPGADRGPVDGGPDSDGGPTDGAAGDGSTADGGPTDGAAADGSTADGAQADAARADGAPPDAAAGDSSAIDAGAIDTGAIDTGAADAVVTDTGAPDATADAGPANPDAAVPDALPLDSGAVTQSGQAAFTGILARAQGPELEWVEIQNTGASPIDLTELALGILSSAGALAIRAASDPTGATGTPVTLAPGAFAFGVPNPALPASIPAGAAFVFGDAGALSPGAFDDGGDAIRLLEADGGVVDQVDFRAAVTDPATPLGSGSFPLVTGVPLELDPSVPAASAATDNDLGARWCAQIFRGGTPGAPNRDCGALVINEVTYDYGSLAGGVDDGRELIEIAGPAGATLAGVHVVLVEGTSPAGNVDLDLDLAASPLQRVPLDGIFVLASGNPNTFVANADWVRPMSIENGADAVQLVRVPAVGPASLLDAFGYGALAADLTDTQRQLAALEGRPVPDFSPDVHTINWARSDTAADTGDNLADFRYDPTPTPGARNGTVAFAVTALEPDDAIATLTATVVIRGADFTDDMSVTVGGALIAPNLCRFVEADALSCVVRYPAGGSGDAERVDVEVAARPEHGGRVRLANAFTWTTVANETGAPTEVDYCNLQHPVTVTVARGVETPNIFGRIYEANVTNTTSGASPAITAELGYGPAGSDPTTSSSWIWVPAQFNVEYGNNDEYRAKLTVQTAGSYLYTYRYSLDGGLSWTYADTDGAGSNNPLVFDPNRLGVLTVNP